MRCAGSDRGWPRKVFFDGQCGLCNGFVDFLLRRDRRKRLRYVPQQSDAALEVRSGGGIRASLCESCVQNFTSCRFRLTAQVLQPNTFQRTLPASFQEF